MGQFLLLQLRPETQAADDEFDSFLRFGGLEAGEVRRVRLDRETLDDGFRAADYDGILVGGGPGCVSDPPESKDPTEARIEAQALALMGQVTQQDLPFFGCCYGIGVLAHHLGAEVSKRRYGEKVGTSFCRKTAAGQADPLLEGLPDAFEALVGHKEAVQNLPEGAVHLVESETCPFQMIRYRSNIYATQFHPEADGEGFAKRIRVYRDHGYFDPDEADALAALCRAAPVGAPPQMLRNFVRRYRRG